MADVHADASGAVERMRWVLEVIADPMGLTLADLEERYDASGWDGWTLEGEFERLRTDERIVRPFTIESCAASGAAQAGAVVVGADDKRWALTCWVSDEAPHLITGTRCMPAPPVGTTIREARPDDALDLAALERRSPLRLGETAMAFDRGDDYFGSARLMEDVTIYVAEVDGVLAGVYWGALQPVLVNGSPKRLFLEHRVRIDPETRRGGVFWALCAYGRDVYARAADTIAFYVSPDNQGVRKFVEGTPSWSVQPRRVLVACTPSSAAKPVPRGATTADAEEIVAVLNAAHEGEELFVPYTVESLTARLERAPDQYGWDSVRIADGAVVGVGRQPVHVTKARGSERRESHRALALDHGFAAGHEGAYRGLLAATCAELADEGVTHLAVFTSASTRTEPVLLELADEVEPYDFWAFAIEEPPSLAARGHYVDPVYF